MSYDLDQPQQMDPLNSELLSIATLRTNLYDTSKMQKLKTLTDQPGWGLEPKF